MKETKYTTFDIFSEAFHDTRKHSENILLVLLVIKSSFVSSLPLVFLTVK